MKQLSIQTTPVLPDLALQQAESKVAKAEAETKQS
jgi:hypothetical protein